MRRLVIAVAGLCAAIALAAPAALTAPAAPAAPAATAATAAKAARPRSCPNANRRATPTGATAMRAAVLCLVNQERASRRLPPLRANARLDHSAQGWTNHMVATGVFSHGSNFAGRISRAGYRWSFVGENIATGYPTPSAVVRGWMHSLGHCRNILDPHFRDLGVGVNPRGTRGYGPATWTQDFGLARGTRPPSHNLGPAAGCPY